MGMAEEINCCPPSKHTTDFKISHNGLPFPKKKKTEKNSKNLQVFTSQIHYRS